MISEWICGNVMKNVRLNFQSSWNMFSHKLFYKHVHMTRVWKTWITVQQNPFIQHVCLWYNITMIKYVRVTLWSVWGCICPAVARDDPCVMWIELHTSPSPAAEVSGYTHDDAVVLMINPQRLWLKNHNTTSHLQLWHDLCIYISAFMRHAHLTNTSSPANSLLTKTQPQV